MPIITLQEVGRRLHRDGLLIATVPEFDNLRIDHLASDSRRVGPGGLFVAIRGVEADGHLFIDKAVQNGAMAVVCEAMPEDRDTRYPGIAFVHVTNSRAAYAEIGAAYYADPSDTLRMVGVTGTNGKTTVTFLIHHALDELGETAGLIGTIETRVGGKVLSSQLTTPDPLDLQRLLREMVDAGCGSCAMEVSSHALDQDRVRAVDYDVAVFTNLTQDHLDYHKTIDAYREAKKRLFDNLRPDAFAVYNIDDASGPRMVVDTPGRAWSYGTKEDADIKFEILSNDMDGLRLRIGREPHRFRLVGRFNAYNLAAASAALQALGYDAARAVDVLKEAPPVPGRFETMHFRDGTRVVVDYAHTPDALENVLQTIVETKSKGSSIWCVFGCGGDRDREKRPLMGAAAERYADHLIVTSDNPRSEDPERILDDIRQGLSNPASARFIVDREEAIVAAARGATQGDVVLVAGKGHEAYQIVDGAKRPFDDREHVREAFAFRNSGQSNTNTLR